MKPYIVYLAGPITGLSFDASVDWRDWVIGKLPPEIQGMSPLRGKTYLEGESKIEDEYCQSVLSCARGITTRDFNDVKRADMILVNFLGAKTPSIGTVMEIAWAKAFQTPVVMVMEKDSNPNDHAMIRECVGFRVETLQQAVEIVKVTLMPAPHRKEAACSGIDEDVAMPGSQRP